MAQQIYLNVPRQPTHQDLRMLPLQHPLISVRPVPDIPVFRFRLCKFPPPQLYCRYGNRCTNAHSEEELQVWNKEKDRRDRGYPQPPQAHQLPVEAPQAFAYRRHTQEPSATQYVPRPQYYRKPKFSSFLERVKEELKLDDIIPELTPDNYKHKFHNLLCWEEKEHITILHERCDGYYPLKIFPNHCIPHELDARSLLPNKIYGCLEVGDGDIIAHATQASEAVYLIASERNEVKGEILRDNFNHTGNKLYISMDPPFTTEANKIEAQFEVKHSYFDSLHKALNSIPDNIIRRLVPRSEDFPSHVNAEALLTLQSIPKEYKTILNLQTLEQDQQQALQIVLSCPSNSPPVLVTGSFGSGKTSFLASVAYCFIAEAERCRAPARILICTHHQATADTIMEKYFIPMLDSISTPLKIEVARITSLNARKIDIRYLESKDFLNNSYKYIKLRKLILVTTFLTAIHLKVKFNPGFFTHILMDEGAQAREPEAIAPLCLADNNTKIIIAGDPQQVGPALLVLGEDARQHGLKLSLLERLLHLYEKIGDKATILLARLHTNFLCHVDILSFASKLFYASIVKPSTVCKKIKPHKEFPFPLVFVCSSKQEINNFESNVNEDEAKLLMSKLVELAEHAEEICVMSSSRGQVTTLRKLRIKNQCPRTIRVLPTFDIQGQEYHSLYISTCEPTEEDGNTRNPTKSICDPFVFNTAITRAKSLVVSFGNPYLLLAIEEHMVRKYGRIGKCWSTYIMECLMRGSFIIPNSVIKGEPEKGWYKSKLLTVLENKGNGAPIGKFVSDSGQAQAVPRKTHPASQKVNKPHPTCAGNNKSTDLQISTMPHTLSIPPIQRVVTSSHQAVSPNINNSHHVPSGSATHATISLKKTANEATNAYPQNPKSSAPSSTRSAGTLPHTQPGPRERPLQRANNELPKLSSKPPTASNGRASQGVIAVMPNEPQRMVTATSTAQQKVVTARPTAPQGVLTPRPNTQHSYEEDFPSLDKAKHMKTPKAVTFVQERIPSTSSYFNRQLQSDPSTSYFEKYRHNLQKSLDVISQPLTASNYKEKFHHLLCWEEEEHCKILTKSDGIYTIIIESQYNLPPWYRKKEFDYYGIITGDDEDVLANAQQAAQGAHITLESGRTVDVDFVSGGLHYGGIVIGFHVNPVAYLKNRKGGVHNIHEFESHVNFELKHSYFQRMHEALDRLPTCVIEKIVPCVADRQSICNPPFIRATNVDKLTLDNTGQMQALKSILNDNVNSSTPIILAGPFGTGKTRVLARAAFELLRHSKRNECYCKILICAHHQASADTFIEYFGMLQKKGMLGKSYTIIRVAKFEYRSKVKEKFPGYFKRFPFKSTDVTVSTLGLSLSVNMQAIKPLTHIFIDEAAQTRETEAIIPLTLAEPSTKIIIAGDHCQVGPDLLVLGEEARQNGLSISLLQRLHEKYYELGDTSNCISLLSNYRSHSGLLMLPSSLFYGSTLQCHVPDSTTHPLAPFPLVFVCSSIEQASVSHNRGTDDTEANILMEQVQTFIGDSWPDAVWGERDDPPGKVCVMTPSPNQKRVIREKMKRHIELNESVQILTAYDIQGQEFAAIFIGTCEATDEDGLPKHMTKTVINRYVFNTAITRSQYLVVAVGNPLTLLEREDRMCQKYPKNEEYRCWKEYIRRCIECKSFHLPPSSNKANLESFTKILHEKVFGLGGVSADHLLSKRLSRKEDSILQAYKKKFESIPDCHKSKLMLSRIPHGGIGWQMKHFAHATESEETEEPEHTDEYEEIYDCKLKVIIYYKAEGVPLNSSKQIVHIHGMKNRQGAFDDDIVRVGVFRGQQPDKYFGKVLKVLKKCHQEKLLCRIHKYNPLLFSPVSKKHPLLSNIPRLSKVYLVKKDKEAIDTELKSRDVAIFDEHSLINDDIPQASNVIPHSVARNMLFIVRILQWNPKYRLPLGIVIHALPMGCSGFHNERILQILYNVEYDKEDKNDLTPPVAPQQSVISGKVDVRAFTIDPQEAVNLDDAISLTLLPRPTADSEPVYQLAVYIVNTCKVIKYGDEIDSKACSLGTSVYSKSNRKVMNMLPSNVRCQLSLQPGQLCDVFCISVKVKDTNDVLSIDHTEEICDMQVKSCAKLSYKTAQDIMDGVLDPSTNKEIAKWMNNFDSDKSQLSLRDTLSFLYKVAMKLRSQRLGSLAALNYDIHESGEEECWQTHLLVEELMVWANSVISTKLSKEFPQCALLRKQNAPNHQELAAISSQHCLVLNHSFSLVKYSQNLEMPQTALAIPIQILQAMLVALTAGKHNILTHLLTAAHLYPQLAACSVNFIKLQRKAEYCCTSEDEETSVYSHYSLNLSTYTHFTSPLRRYADIIVQRMIMSFLDDSECHYTHDEIDEMCHQLNAAMKNSKGFEKEMNAMNLALKYSQSSDVYDVFIASSNGKEIEVCFPQLEMKDIPARQKRILVKTLNCKIKSSATNLQATQFSRLQSVEGNIYSWSVKLLFLENPSLLFQHEDLGGVSYASAKEKDQDAHCGVLSLPHIILKTFQPLQESSMLKETSHYVSMTPTAVTLQPKEWSKFTSYIQHPSERESKELLSILNTKLKIPPKERKDVSMTSFPFMKCDVSCRMDMNDMTRVWMTWSTRDAILAPQIQMVEIAPFLRICVQHNTHPAECFSESQLQHASKEKYCNLQEYVALWEKVLLAEAAQRSVNDSQMGILFDVTLKWPELVIPKNCLDDIYYVPKGFIELTMPQNIIENVMPFLKVHIGDMLCVRYGTEKNSDIRAVFHMVVSKSYDDTDTQTHTLFLKVIGEDNCRISDKMRSIINEKCEVQVISMSPSYQRVYKGLLKLLSVSEDTRVISQLSRDVALGRTCLNQKVGAPVDGVFTDPLVTCLWSNPRASSFQPSGIFLNFYQKQAMKVALTKRFYLIQGPPGTGKSETGAHIAYALAMSNRAKPQPGCVLYCGPTNKAVDVVLENLHRLIMSKRTCLKILRIYGHAIEVKEFPGPYTEKTTFQVSDSEYRRPIWADIYSLHCIIRDPTRKEKSQQLVDIEKTFKEEKLKGHIPDARKWKEWKKCVYNAEKSLLKNNNFDIVLCTCNEASSGRIENVHPLQCIIDESGMAYEPETIVPISLCEHAVLLGDHKQLQPVIEYKPARENGLTTSLFERYAESNFDLCVMLEVQYRMHEKICEFPSNYFYDGVLKTDESVKQRTNYESKLTIWPKGPEYPIVFCDVVGREEIHPSKRSKSNLDEARHMVNIALVLRDVYRVKADQIALMTPYSDQKSKISQLAAEVGLTGSERQPNVTVATITESQGDEYGFVILSTVRSLPLAEIRNEDLVQPDRSWLLENLGFLIDKHQINVGITRSKYGLIIVGNKTLLGYDETWRELIAHYKKRGCLLSKSLFPTKEDLKKCKTGL